jgi:peroxiredoxin
LRDHHDEIRARGADVVAIGTGNPMYAKDFIEQFSIPFLVLIDADAAAARAASVKRGSKRDLIGPGAILRGAARFFKGGRQGKPGARISQLGATFVIAPGGRILFEHLAATSDDNAPVEDAIAALPS